MAADELQVPVSLGLMQGLKRVDKADTSDGLTRSIMTIKWYRYLPWP